VVILDVLRSALLGGSDRTSCHNSQPSLADTRTGFRKDAIAYVGGSNTLIVCSQERITSGNALLGNRPRPANTK